MQSTDTRPRPIVALENFLFSHKLAVLIFLGLLTVLCAWRAGHVQLATGFERQLPTNHELIETFYEFRDRLPGPNGVFVVAEAPNGTVWDKDYLTQLKQLTDDLFFLPGVFRPSVKSVWTPNTRVFEIDEEGLHAHDLISGTVTADELTPEIIASIREDAQNTGLIGQLVANDSSSALVQLEVMDRDPITGERLNYLDLADRLEEIQQKYEERGINIRVIGFARLIGEVANATAEVLIFFGISFVLTAAILWLYIRHFGLTFLAVGASAVSVLWQFGFIEMMGFGLDPMAILVPFLVYAIGVSHGIQQINLISREVAEGSTPEAASRRTFEELFIPGGIAIVTDMFGFLLLLLIPIPMVREIAILAAVGIALKLVANLILLPLLATYLRFSPRFIDRHRRLLSTREAFFRRFAALTTPRNAVAVTVVTFLVLGLSAYMTRDRKIGDLDAGAPQLKANHDYNQDWRAITSNYGINLDSFIVVMETPKSACIDGDIMEAVDDLTGFLSAQSEVVSVVSPSSIARRTYVIWQEGNLKWRQVPSNRYVLAMTTGPIPSSSGILSRDCDLMTAVAFTRDHKAETVDRLIAATEDFIDREAYPEISYHLASGNVAIIAATNEVIRDAELPMLLAIFAVIAVLVFAAHRDWRAVVACCLPLMLATFLGYWLMTGLSIGLTTATLPVLVMAAAIGVDYALYIFARLQPLLKAGRPIHEAVASAMQQTGAAVLFTGLVLGFGVIVWAFSSLKFQADMGLLLAFMFVANMLVAIFVLPALAALLYRNPSEPNTSS